jgi:hypothetical protein
MNYLPEWGDHTALLSIAIIFLIASIAGWYGETCSNRSDDENGALPLQVGRASETI